MRDEVVTHYHRPVAKLGETHGREVELDDWRDECVSRGIERSYSYKVQEALAKAGLVTLGSGFIVPCVCVHPLPKGKRVSTTHFEGAPSTQSTRKRDSKYTAKDTQYNGEENGNFEEIEVEQAGQEENQ